MALTEKQKAEREQKLGSSDAPIVAGVSPYKGPLELYYQLHGELPRYTTEETREQKIGSRIEPIVAELGAEEAGVKIRRCPTKHHPVHSFMVANLDYEIIANPKGPGIFEVKNRIGSKPFDTLPDDITLQTAHQMAVTMRDWGLVVVLFGFGQLRTYEIARDKELEDYLIEIEARFMVRVQKGEPPDHTWTPETIGILKKLYPASSRETITLPDTFAHAAQDFLDCKQKIEEWEQVKAMREGLLKEAIKDADKATVAGFEISWKSTKPSQRFDEERFAREHPALYSDYKKTVPGYRRFTVKPSKEIV